MMKSGNSISHNGAKEMLRGKHYRWLVTGAAGFIGSHLVDELLKNNQQVVGFDNFETGKRENLEDVRKSVGEKPWREFRFVEGSICEVKSCQDVTTGVDFILHHAALGSVPFSFDFPAKTHATNVTGFLNVLEAARSATVKRVVYASSSAVYGDVQSKTHTEVNRGRPLSPYAVSKNMNEETADQYTRLFKVSTVGLRYFNIFGPRQDVNGAYSAVIPKWIENGLAGRDLEIYGTGETTRDFCYVKDVFRANIQAALSPGADISGESFNIGLGSAVSLNQLAEKIQIAVQAGGGTRATQVVRGNFRAGDILHSCADMTKTEKILGFHAKHSIDDGLALTVDWYRTQKK